MWWENAVFYEIYIASFADSDGDGIGDINGIREKLPYLKESGMDALWLTPFYPSPKVDNGYDVSDYCGVDPQYGTLAAFDLLVEEAHQLEMRIIIDVVVNPNILGSSNQPVAKNIQSGTGIYGKINQTTGKVFFVVLLGSMTRLRINIITIALPKSKQT